MSAPYGLAGIGVSIPYFSTRRCIEDRQQTECRANENEVSICDEEGGCARELAPPEEVDFAVCCDEVLEEDEYWDSAGVNTVP